METTFEEFFHRKITDDELECLIRFNKLDKDNKILAQAYMIKLTDNQQQKESKES